MIKQCLRCREVKDVAEFSKNRSNKYGYQHSCKVCRKIESKTYFSSEKGKRASRRSAKKRALFHPKKVKAVSKINNHITSGKLIRKSCVICGEPNTEAHHPDYNKPLEIVWLCLSHHRQWHSMKKVYEVNQVPTVPQ